MSSVDYVELGRRLVACKHFRPMRGMRDVQGRTWDESLLWRWENRCDVPDLTDPATLGCVLALVREAHSKPAVPMFWGDYWQIVYTAEVDDGCASHEHIGEGDTEAEALVVALEAVP